VSYVKDGHLSAWIRGGAKGERFLHFYSGYKRIVKAEQLYKGKWSYFRVWVEGGPEYGLLCYCSRTIYVEAE
jgi:hypothetical protein